MLPKQKPKLMKSARPLTTCPRLKACWIELHLFQHNFVLKPSVVEWTILLLLLLAMLIGTDHTFSYHLLFILCRFTPFISHGGHLRQELDGSEGGTCPPSHPDRQLWPWRGWNSLTQLKASDHILTHNPWVSTARATLTQSPQEKTRKETPARQFPQHEKIT